MRKRITIDVSDTDRRRLMAIVTDRNSPQKHVWRAQIVLLTADGCGTMGSFAQRYVERHGLAEGFLPTMRAI